VATYRYLRIRFFEPSSAATSGTLYRISALELLEGETSLDLSGATITANADGGTLSGTTSNLTDSDAGTYLAFVISDRDSERPYLDIDLGSEQDVTGIAITLHSSDTEGIGRMSVWGWVGGQYDTTYADYLFFDAAIPAWTAPERREFDWLRTDAPNYRYYRLTIDACAGSGANFGVLQNVEFYYGDAGLDLSSGSYRDITTTGPTSSPAPENLFDNDTGTLYDWGSVTGPQSVSVDFGGSIGVSTVNLSVPIGLESRAIESGSIAGSNDGTTWVTLAEFSGLGAPSTYGYYLELPLTDAPAEPENPAYLRAPIPCANVRAQAFTDFTGQLDNTEPSRYTMDIVAADNSTTRVPISSWQATLQTDRQTYVQCVIPNCDPFVEAIQDGVSFRIFRRGKTKDGAEIETLFAAAPLQSYTLSEGFLNFTATIYGYTDPYPSNDDPDSLFDRTLTGIRSITQTPSTLRARAAVDWLLQPGQRAYLDEATSFVVGYINFYVTGGDEYIDVGSRAL
jgi:hypothetical protein